ncbi:hypothetical protein T01_9579 [Trichinella spiralis]|uniref:Uncharacterized protein n=1 Tax=Trichinella spiralis TaxID=6334 RepID=A0A0V1BJK2_TRISP|nr:hypothetical protein T01_9579 [Trichinella spiralis]
MRKQLKRAKMIKNTFSEVFENLPLFALAEYPQRMNALTFEKFIIQLYKFCLRETLFCYKSVTVTTVTTDAQNRFYDSHYLNIIIKFIGLSTITGKIIGSYVLK